MRAAILCVLALSVSCSVGGCASDYSDKSIPEAPAPAPHAETLITTVTSATREGFLFRVYSISLPMDGQISYGWDNHHFGGKTSVAVNAGDYFLHIMRDKHEGGWAALDLLTGSRKEWRMAAGADVSLLSGQGLPGDGIAFADLMQDTLVLSPGERRELLTASGPGEFSAKAWIGVEYDGSQ